MRGGRLLITAHRESPASAPDWGGQKYTSARLLTRGLAEWTDGFFEIRAKLAGNGAHGVGAAVTVPDSCGAFHHYQMLWTERDIRLAVDGIEHLAYPRLDVGAAGAARAWPFDGPQFLLLDVAIGGDLGGPVDDGIFPVTMEVDYVRVYQAPK